MDNFEDFDFDLIALGQDFAFAGSGSTDQADQGPDLKQTEVSADELTALVSNLTPRNNKRPLVEALEDREGIKRTPSPLPSPSPLPAPVPDVLLDAPRIARRKEIVSLLFKYWLTDFDVRNLARHIAAHCDAQVMYISPSIRDPVFGTSDLLTLFTLSMETCPDAVSPIHSLEVEEDKVVVVFSFQGTKVYPAPIATVFKQLKAHLQSSSKGSGAASSAMASTGSSAGNTGISMGMAGSSGTASFTGSMASTPSTSSSSASNAFIASIAQKIRPTVVEGFVKSSDSSSASASCEVQEMDSYLRTAPVENAVLKGGPVSFTRQINFYFDGDDRILRITSFTV